MTELARRSAAARRTVIHDFVTGALGELDVPAYRQGLPAATPELPADPTDEQVDAWIELGELVRDPALRAGLRRMARYAAEHPAGESAEGATGTEVAERVTDPWFQQVTAARQQGIAPDSPAADAVVATLVVTWIPTQPVRERAPAVGLAALVEA